MNSRNFIHLVLIAVLCFSQLAASVHVAGHLHDHDHEHNASINCIDPQPPCGDPSDAAASVIPSHGAGNQFSTGKTGDAPTTDSFVSDCAIYHAFLGLSGCLSSAPPDLTSAMQSAVNVASYVTHVANLSADNRRIRGPPQLS